MRLTRIAFLSLACSVAFSPAGGETRTEGHADRNKNSKAPGLSEHERALHALQRLTFGPRPGDIEAVMAAGVDNWIEQQLNPSQIPNSGLDGRLAPYRTLHMTPRDAAQNFPSGQMIREAAEGKRAMPSDPVQFGLWEILVDKYKEQQKNNATPPAPSAMSAADAEAAQKAAEQSAKDAARHLAEMLLGLPRPNRITALMKLPVNDRRTLSQYLPADLRDKLIADFSPAERETFFSIINYTDVVITDLHMT